MLTFPTESVTVPSDRRDGRKREGMRVILEGTSREMREFFAGAAIPATADTGLEPQAVSAELSQITSNARIALRFICEHAPQIGFDAVAERVGVTTKVLSGNMSSLWNSAPTIAGVLDRDYGKRVYLIDPSDAKIVLEAFETLE